MSARSKLAWRITIAGACMSPATAAPAPQASRLSYDAAVFLEGACLSPALSGCNLAPVDGPAGVSASQALLAAGGEPRLPYELAGLLEMGPQVTAAEAGWRNSSDEGAEPGR